MEKYYIYTQSSDKEKRKKGKKKVIDDLMIAINRNDLEAITTIFKQSGYLINEMRNNKKEIQEIISLCDLHITCLDWKKVKKKLLYEADIFNNLFYKVKQDLQEVTISLPENKKTIYYMVTIECKLREFLYSINEMNSNFTNFEEKLDLENMMELYIETTGIVLRYLDYYEKIDIDNFNKILTSKVEQNYLEIAHNYIQLAEIWKGLKEIVDIWMYDEVEIIVEDKTVTFNTKSDKVLEKIVAQISYNDVVNAKEISHVNLELLKPKFNRSLLYKNSSLNDHESAVFSKSFFDDILFVDVKKELYKNISLEELIIAYSLIVNLAKKRYKTQKKISSFETFEDILIVENKEYWINQLNKSKISKEKIEAIFNLIVFDASRDSLDCPLYKIGGYYILIPSLAVKINPATSLLSNLNKRGIDISFKGKYFENYLLNIVKKTNCKVSQFHQKVSGDEFECDLIIEISGDIILVEAKNLSPIGSFRDYISNEEKLREACDQLNKTAKLLEKHADIKSILGIDKINSITKLVVSSIPIGQNKIINDVFVTDEIYFSGYFQRKSPMLHHADFNSKELITYRLYTEFYDGDLSIDQFKALLINDPLKSSIRKNRIISMNTKNDKYKMIHEFYFGGTSSVAIANKFSNEDISKFI